MTAGPGAKATRRTMRVDNRMTDAVALNRRSLRFLRVIAVRGKVLIRCGYTNIRFQTSKTRRQNFPLQTVSLLTQIKNFRKFFLPLLENYVNFGMINR